MTVQQAVESENLAALANLMRQNPDQINETSPDGLWLPFWAAITGRTAALEYIAQYCAAANLDRVDANGRNLLHYAAQSGCMETLRYVAEQLGFSLLAGDHNGITPYELAQEQGGEAAQWCCRKTGLQPNQTFQNPVARGCRPDPSVLVHGEDFYMVNSSFVLFPCIPISHSRDLVHWQTIGYAITDAAQSRLAGLAPGCGYWAPDISFYNGKFYIVATLRLNGSGPAARVQMMTWADQPQGPYAPPVFIEEDGIDPSLFCDDDGRRYLLLNRGARVLEISEHGERLSAPRMLYYGDTHHKSEGPHLLKKDGWYYLFQAEGGTGEHHQISVARAKNLFGEYERCPYNPILTQAEGDPYLHRCGHGKPLCTADGRWFLMYLCSRKTQHYSLLGRETALDPLCWTADGWPLVNDGRGASAIQKAPLPAVLPPPPADALDWRDPRSEWLGVRGFHSGLAKITDGWRFSSDSVDLCDVGTPCVLFKRQKEFCFTEQVLLLAGRLAPGQNAGLAGYYDETSHCRFGLLGTPQGNRLALTMCTPAQENQVVFSVACPAESLWLRVSGDGLYRSFFTSVDGQNFSLATVLESTAFLADEGAPGKRFTGALHGPYAALGANVCFTHYAHSDI